MSFRVTLQQADRRERRGIMAALDAAHCLLWFNPEGEIIDANANCQSLLGMPLLRLQGQTYREIANGPNGGNSDNYYRVHWGRISRGELKAEERDIYTASGIRLWCSMTHATIRNDDGALRLVFTMLVDLSPWNRNPKDGLRRVY